MVKILVVFSLVYCCKTANFHPHLCCVGLSLSVSLSCRTYQYQPSKPCMYGVQDAHCILCVQYSQMLRDIMASDQGEQEHTDSVHCFIINFTFHKYK